jgi:hypothetical protein
LVGVPIESIDSMGAGAAEHVRERTLRCATERAHKATRASWLWADEMAATIREDVT